MKSIGGFFELELPNTGLAYHQDSIGLSTGRACISLFILTESPKKVFIPFYTCDAFIDPFQKHGVDFEFYEINENLEPVVYPILRKGEYFIFINYFGVKQDFTIELIERYGNKLLVDNTHYFFHRGYTGIWSFTSARKHFGIPDGAYVYTPKKVNLEFDRFKNISIEPFLQRLLGNQTLAYNLFRDYEASLDSEIKRMSVYSERVLQGIDYERIRLTRVENFEYLKNQLLEYNRLKVNSSYSPFCYPLWPKRSINHGEFHSHGIFIPFYWKEVKNRAFENFNLSLNLSNQLLPLPIDQRYGKVEMDRIIDFIRSY